MDRQIPVVNGDLRSHILTVPETIWRASGIVVMGRRIKSLLFSTDIAIICNCNADAVLAVYPFTPQQRIANAIVTSSSIPVFCGVGGGVTNGPRSVMLARDAEAHGAFGVVVNVPMANETIAQMHRVIDIPVIATVVSERMDIDARVKAGAAILNVSAADRTPELVRHIRADFPTLPIIATGGPNDETVAETIDAGANAISYTPPSTKKLFESIMNGYRDPDYPGGGPAPLSLP
ncbi:MAG: hydrolase [Aristaeellaceae bacterium]